MFIFFFVFSGVVGVIGIYVYFFRVFGDNVCYFCVLIGGDDFWVKVMGLEGGMILNLYGEKTFVVFFRVVFFIIGVELIVGRGLGRMRYLKG